MNEQNKSKYQFINPYNFVSLGNKCTRKYISKVDKKFTGYMECELETKTPLIMIDSMNKIQNEDGHTIYPSTFMLNHVPAIPASELRGCIRSKFETLTNSCLSTIEEDAVFTGRFKSGQLKNPGLLDYSDPDNVQLYSAKGYKIKNIFDIPESLKTGDIIQFNLEEYDLRGQTLYNAIYSKNGKYEGVFKLGELFGRKQSRYVFVKDKNLTNTLQNKNNLKKMYKNCVELSTVNMKHKHASETNKTLRPVWYQIINNVVYIALGQNGQLQFNRMVKDVLPNEYNPCQDSEHLCEACYVFGTVNEKKAMAIPSRVRFTDARITNLNKNNCYEYPNPITLAELATPKFKNASFYLKLKEIDQIGDVNFTWNVDVKNTWQTKCLRDGEVSIRGRKEYWHHIPRVVQIKPVIMNSTVHPIKIGAKYSFRVYFDDITQEQLDHLIMSISLENNSDYCHKLGMGKPLGFGSVKIKVNDVKVRNLSFDEESKTIARNVVDYVSNCKTLEDAFKNLNEIQFKEIKNLYSFNFLSKFNARVDYPRNSEKGDIFKWFADGKTPLPFAGNEKHIVQDGKFEKNNNNRKPYNPNLKKNNNSNNNFGNKKKYY